MSQQFNVAVLGASGAVGQAMIEILEERAFPVATLYPLASSRSAGDTVRFGGKNLEIKDVEEFDWSQVQIALFSAGAEVSAKWAPIAAEHGCIVIDNTSCFRYDADIPLIVPEINGHLLSKEDLIIANPNCSTIQLVMVLAPLHRKYGVKRVVVSTYQSITGTGVKAVQQLQNERAGVEGEMAYKYPIDKNCIPQCDVFLDNGYTKEEMKLTNETKKILDPTINVTATAVRVPVVGGHSEAVNISFDNDFDLQEVRALLSQTPGITLQDNTAAYDYPMPRFAEGKDDVFVGRIRRDESQANTLNLWIVADNLRKGAATNAVQIAKLVAASI